MGESWVLGTLELLARRQVVICVLAVLGTDGSRGRVLPGRVDTRQLYRLPDAVKFLLFLEQHVCLIYTH